MRRSDRRDSVELMDIVVVVCYAIKESRCFCFRGSRDIHTFLRILAVLSCICFGSRLRFLFQLDGGQIIRWSNFAFLLLQIYWVVLGARIMSSRGVVMFLVLVLVLMRMMGGGSLVRCATNIVGVGACVAYGR